MTGNSSTGESNDRLLAELFIDIERRGSIALQEYRERYPQLAEEIDRLVPLGLRVEKAAESGEPPLPPRLGDFRIVRKIDHGGMGEVYEAFQERLNRRVAIKVIRQGRALPASPAALLLRERFLREQAVLARLHQTHIVPIHTADEAAGLQYFVMPYIEGATLRHAVTAARNLASTDHGERAPTLGELIREPSAGSQPARPLEKIEYRSESTAMLPPGSAVGSDESPRLPRRPDNVRLSTAYFRSVATILADAADALQHAHDAGILHRDIKPSNIMVNAQGQCFLIDFGLARFRGQDEKPAADHSHFSLGDMPLASGVLGTPNYMAPEQIDGKDSELCDVWGLGVTLYELLTLRRAFEGETPAELSNKIKSQSPPSPDRFVKNVPADLAAICLKAAKKEPNARYKSAAALAEDLRRWLRYEPTAALPALPLRRFALWSRRNKGWAAALALAFVLLFAGVAMSQWQRATAESQRVQEILQARKRASVQLMNIHDVVRLRMSTPTQGRRNGAVAALEKTAEPRRLIADKDEAAKLDLVSRSLLAEALACPELIIKETARLPQINLHIWPVAMHPNGKQMAVGTAMQPLVWKRGEKLRGPETIRPGSRLTYSPDGKWLIVLPDGGGVELWDADATRREVEWKKPDATQILGYGVSANSDAILTCTAAGVVQTLSLPKLEEGAAWKLTPPEKAWTAAAFDRQGKRLATANTDGFVTLHASDGSPAIEFKADRTEIESLAWSHDEKLLAVASVAGKVSVWDIDNRIPLLSFQLMGGDYTWLEFTPDGWLLAGRRQGQTLIWNTATGQQILTGDLVERGSLSADGRFLAASRGGGETGVAFCELQRPESILEYIGHRNMIQQLAWSADNRSLATIDNAFQIHVWRLDAATPFRSIVVPHEQFFAHRGNAALALSDDGSLLAYASGGGLESHLLLYDIDAGKELWQGKLSGGYEHLAAVGDDRFVLVHDEHAPVRRAVLYEWTADGPPKLAKVVRESGAGERGTFLGALTADGQTFCWAGPNDPGKSRRVEVCNLKTGDVVLHSEPDCDAMISDDGKALYLKDAGQQGWRYDLTKDGAKEKIADMPRAVSAKSAWTVFMPGTAEVALSLHRGQEEKPWLEFYNRLDSISCQPAFSRDGRYLAWGVDRGAVKVADLSSLDKRIATFEKSVLPK